MVVGRRTWTVRRRLILRAQVRAGQNHSLAGLVQAYPYAVALASKAFVLPWGKVIL